MSERRRPVHVIVTCEHGGNRVPRQYAPIFRGRSRLLRSHRGWDPGALELAGDAASALAAPLHAATVSRLLIDLNRSLRNSTVFSEFTAALPARERSRMTREYYRPYRDHVEKLVSERARRGRVIHVSVHTFTPVLRGERRRADVGLLFDPARSSERTLCHDWKRALVGLRPRLRVRMNDPYRGTDDGLTTALRTRFRADRYSGIELEVNQRFPRRGGRAWASLRRDIVRSLVEVIGRLRSAP